MTEEQPEVAPMNSKGVGSLPLEPEHEYRFQKSDKIAERYQVIAPLGFGGFSEVYRCEDLTLHSDVAVKVLFEKGLGLEEARAAARLRRHPYIVPVYDVLTPEGQTPFIIFEYVEGETLEKRLNRGQYRRLPLNEDTLRIVYQISEALDYAHGRGVIHRDVKPSNIILDREGNACLTDFGLAEVKRPAGESMLSAAVQHRLSGTIPYMAPEQLREETPGDARSDLYSLGVVVYEMLTGQLPYPYRGRDASLIYQIGSSEPIPPTQANPELPKGIESVLLRALARDPAARYPSCLTFAKDLEKAAKAYVAASSQYEQARKHFDARQWRQAVTAFEALRNQAPGFKDTDHYLEQARHQVRLLELYEKAQTALKQGKYQDALNTLNVLTQMEPDYDVADLREQAWEGLAQEEKRSLDEQYQQAVQQFQKEKYEACLDTLAVIRGRDPNYPDPEGIEAPAREHVERQQRLHALYAQGVEQIGQESWMDAIATFEKLRQEAPGYEDVETRLAMARHMARMSSLMQEARAFLEQGAFAASVDKLGELQRIAADYKQDAAIQLRQEALNRLHGQVERLLQEKRFEESLAALAELRERSSDYPDVDELEAQARQGIQVRDLRAELDGLYQQAVAHLNQRSYAEAFRLWQEIQQQKGGLDYPDPREVESRARDGLCLTLYNQALGALTRKNPHQALELWHQVREVDPNYLDGHQVEERAQAMIRQREKIQWWALRLGGGAIVLLLLGALVTMAIRGCNPPSPATLTLTPSPASMPTVPPTVPTPTPTHIPSPTPMTPTSPAVSIATPTRTPTPTVAPTRSPSPAPTSVTPSATPTPTSSPTPSSTPTLSPTPPSTPTLSPTPSPTPTSSPTPGGTPGALATALQGASIFAAPDADSPVLGGISAGEQVPVLGRSAYGQWYYVRNNRGVEGFVYAPRFEWSGDYESLPIIPSTVPPATPVPTRPPTPLEMDLWDISGTERCSGGIWYKSVYIQGHGGNGVYTYYWNEEKKAGPTSESYTFEVYSVGGAIIGTGKVISGDGQTIERRLYIESACK